MQGRSGKRGALLTFAILLTVSSGTAYAADPIEIKETTSIAVKDGASYSYGSDETESLTIAVENSDDGAAIAVDGSSAAGGSKASLTLSGKNIAVTVPKGIFNGNTEGGIIPSNDTGTAYAGGTVQIGSESTDVVKVSGELRTVGAGAATTLRGSQITTDAVNTYNEGETTFGTEETRLVTLKKTNTLNHASLTVLGKQIVFKDEAATDSGTTNEIGHEYIYAVNGSSVTIGSDATESVHVGDGIAIRASDFTVKGQHIVLGTKNLDYYHQWGGTATIGGAGTSSVESHGPIRVWSHPSSPKFLETTITADAVTLDSKIDAYGSLASLIVDGVTISQTEEKPWDSFMSPVRASSGGLLVLGSSQTESLSVTGEVQSSEWFSSTVNTQVKLDGKEITLKNGAKAEGKGSLVAIGTAGVTKTLTGDLLADAGTVTAVVSDVYTGNATAKWDRKPNEITKNAGTLSLTAASAKGDLSAEGPDSTLTATLSDSLVGNLKATDRSLIKASIGGTLTGDVSAIDSDITLTAGSVIGNLYAEDDSPASITADVGNVTGSVTAVNTGAKITLTADTVTGSLATLHGGTLTASIANTFMGTTSDDSIEDLATNDLVLNLAGGATWNLTDSSTVSTLNAEGGSVSLMDGRLGETLTAGSFAGDGATLYLDADGSTNTGNDHLYVTGSHTGTTALHLSSTSNTWSGVLGTVLASVGEEQGSFASDGETEAALYYYNLELASTSDNVTDGYSTDWYLKGFTKAPTNDEGHHTTVVRNLGGITGGNYLLWRSDMDTLFRRMGEADGSLTDNTDNGIWARGKGKKFSRESDFLVDSKYNEYEVGYDWLHKKTETKEHVIGVGFAYLDGDATYVSGKGDLKGYTLGLYDTQVWKNGQYLDLSLKGSRYENEFGYTGLGRFIDGQSNSTGFSFGAEYGYKKKDEKGWFVEPQAQVVLGHFRNDAFTDSNGVHVEGESMNTALGRIGARAGYESPRVTVYAKANWYHDFGGNHVTVMSVDTDRLRVHEDYGDTWFSYGLGGAYKINDGLQAYFDLERGDGSSYDENWSWDVGLRWSF